jgi:hypothetical protein
VTRRQPAMGMTVVVHLIYTRRLREHRLRTKCSGIPVSRRHSAIKRACGGVSPYAPVQPVGEMILSPPIARSKASISN